MLFTSIYRKKINAAEALIPLVAFNFKTYQNYAENALPEAFFQVFLSKTAGKASVLSFYQADFLVMKLLGSSLIGLLQCTVYACRILSAGLSHARTAAAAAAN